jgi:hypothetical protein
MEDMTRDSAPRSIAILLPVFNDWNCLAALIPELSAICSDYVSVDLVVVDDGSSLPLGRELSSLDAFRNVEIVRLGSNVGHQRAIAVGLCHVANKRAVDAIVVMDSDGEDSPSQISSLLHQLHERPDSIIVAQRRKRSEPLPFRLSYRIYRGTFRLMTGETLDFGNFSAMSLAAATRLSYMTSLWNHFPATISRSRLSIVRVPLDRHHRIDGTSRMNSLSLINHGLAAMAAFLDLIFVRLFMIVAVLAGATVAVALTAVAIRLFTGAAIPGWATLTIGLAGIALFQLLSLLIVTTFLLLSSRSTVSPPPSAMAPTYVQSVVQLRDSSERHE